MAAAPAQGGGQSTAPPLQGGGQARVPPLQVEGPNISRGVAGSSDQRVTGPSCGVADPDDAVGLFRCK